MARDPVKKAETLLNRASMREGSFVTASESTTRFRLEVHRLITDTIVVLIMDHEIVAQYSLARGLEYDSGYQGTRYFCQEIRRRVDNGQRI